MKFLKKNRFWSCFGKKVRFWSKFPKNVDFSGNCEKNCNLSNFRTNFDFGQNLRKFFEKISILVKIGENFEKCRF